MHLYISALFIYDRPVPLIYLIQSESKMPHYINHFFTCFKKLVLLKNECTSLITRSVVGCALHITTSFCRFYCPYVPSQVYLDLRSIFQLRISSKIFRPIKGQKTFQIYTLFPKKSLTEVLNKCSKLKVPLTSE